MPIQETRHWSSVLPQGDWQSVLVGDGPDAHRTCPTALAQGYLRFAAASRRQVVRIPYKTVAIFGLGVPATIA